MKKKLKVKIRGPINKLENFFEDMTCIVQKYQFFENFI